MTSGTAQLAGNALPYRTDNANVASDGTFQLGGVPAGSYTLTVTVSNPQGSALVGTLSPTITAGQVLPLTVTMPATGALSGIVTTATGAPLPGATVRAYATPAYTFARSTTTDTSGAFTLADLPVGPYEVDVSDPRTPATFTRQVTVNQDATTTVSVSATVVGNVRVQVNYARGVPAVNALVTIIPSVRSGYYFYTDTTGSVTIPNEQAGTFTVTGYYPNNTSLFAQASGAIANEGDTSLLTITLPAAGTISGQVTYGSGSPAVSANVSLISQGNQIQSVYTDGSGGYTFPGLTLGTPYSVTAARPYPTSNVTRTVSATPLTSDGQVETLNLTLPSVATVAVTALRYDGTPLYNARVEWIDSVHTYFQFAGYTDANGKFNLSNIAEGSFTVNLRDPQTSASLVQATGTVHSTDEGAVIPFTMQLTVPSGSVQGTVVDAGGTPVPSTPVDVFNTRDSYTLTSTTTAADGTYQTSTIQPGDQGFTVYAYTPNYSLNVSLAGTFTSSGQVATVNVTLPVLQGTVTGRVLGGDGVTPLANAYVEIDTSDDSFLDSTYADQNGVYTFANEWLPSAGFTVLAQTPDRGSQASSQALQISTDGQTIDVTVTVPVFTGTVTGTVFGGDGVTPVADTYVRLTGGCGGECGVYLTTYTASDGTYSFGPFDAGSSGFVIDVYDPAFVEQTGSFTSQGQELTVNLTAPASVVRGTLTYADGTLPPSDSATVFVTGSDDSAYYYWIIDAADNYVVFGAPSGDFTISGQDGVSGLQTSASGTITSASVPTIVNLTLPADGTVNGHVQAADGTPLANVSVALTSSSSFQRYTSTDATGAFSFAHVPLGAVTVQAAAPSGTLTANTSVGSQGQVVSVTLSP